MNQEYYVLAKIRMMINRVNSNKTNSLEPLLRCIPVKYTTAFNVQVLFVCLYIRFKSHIEINMLFNKGILTLYVVLKPYF